MRGHPFGPTPPPARTGPFFLPQQHIVLRCRDDHQWTEALPTGVPLAEIAMRLKPASRCPACGRPSFLWAAPPPKKETP